VLLNYGIATGNQSSRQRSQAGWYLVHDDVDAPLVLGLYTTDVSDKFKGEHVDIDLHRTLT
jgi:hypothetical protein